MHFWMLENCLDLTAEMPVMLTIPSERVLGPGYGKLFCVIPRGENTSLAVNHITWQSQGNGLHPDVVLLAREPEQRVRLAEDGRVAYVVVTPAVIGVKRTVNLLVAFVFSMGRNEEHTEQHRQE